MWVDKRRGVRIQVYLTPDDEFYAKYGGKTYKCKSRAELEGHLTNGVREAFEIVWHPVIEVEELQPFHGHTREAKMIGFQFTRYYIGTSNTDTLYKYDQWVDDPSEIDFTWSSHLYEKVSWFHPPQSQRSGLNDGIEYLFDYTLELWTALGALQKRIAELHAQLQTLLTTPEGIAHMQKVGASIALNALPAPKESGSTDRSQPSPTHERKGKNEQDRK